MKNLKPNKVSIVQSVQVSFFIKVYSDKNYEIFKKATEGW